MLTKKTNLTGRQKAGVFLIAIGNDVATEIFKHLREDEIEQITFEIARLDKITPEDKEKVLIEFNEMMMAQGFMTNGGIDFARGLLEKSLGNQKAIDIGCKVVALDAYTNNFPAHKFYYNLGFVPKGFHFIKFLEEQ
jgi:flagellar motor switch protein FliG